MTRGATVDGSRETPASPPCVPPCIAEALPGASDALAWMQSSVGQSGAAVWRLRDLRGGRDHYLKHGTGDVAAALCEEAARLHWLAGRVAVPELIAFADEADAAWLLTAALPCRTAWEILDAGDADAGAVVDAIAACLQEWHTLAPKDCPFNASAPQRLAAARDRIDAELVDTDDFDSERTGWSAEQVWDALAALPLPSAPRVVTHGDFSLDNILIADGRVSGCIDVGRAGLADRYQDIAILWNCLGEFGPHLQSRLLAALGEGSGDRARIDFHLLLDELF